MKNSNESSPAEIGYLSLVLEVTSDPKPGNVDRGHDHVDTGLHDFLISASRGLRVFKEIENGEYGVGEGFYEAVKTGCSRDINTWFGSYLLLVPLILADGKGVDVRDVLENSTVDDAVWFYRSFEEVDVYVPPRDELDVMNEDSRDKLVARNLSFLDVMEISSDVDTVADELVSDYPRSRSVSKSIERMAPNLGLNDAIARTYIDLLSEEVDTHIVKRHGYDVANWVREVACLVREGSMGVDDMDEELIARGVNPGTTADLIVGGLYMYIRDNGGVVPGY